MKFAIFVLLATTAALRGQSPATAADMLARVAEFHGNAGVFAVAGYRMGERALHELAEPRGSFNLDVTHRTPLQVQYSCVADGWQAATGVSAGKLNLHIVETKPGQLESVIKDAKTGKELTFRLRPTFLEKYLNTPYDRQASAAREIASLPDDQIFVMIKNLPR
ncbi:MAG TPA: formylmethanofuran dehydrogenase subunit E family protein [Bryobacteraceae bacterium]|nr:formylmethanofuran dehydrogenase subunit E family protein [Bryobacteraceae bacterium]